MNRRQFLGAFIAAVIMTLMLPFERFAEWCKGWLKSSARTVSFEDLKRDSYEYRLTTYPSWTIHVYRANWPLGATYTVNA